MKTNRDDTGDDDWLDSTLQQWGERSLGGLPSDLGRRITSRMTQPQKSLLYRGALVAMGVFLVATMGAGWWLTRNDFESGHDTVAINVNVNSDSTKNSKVPTHSTANDETTVAELQLIQHRMQSLQSQLSVDRMDAELKSLDERFHKFTTEVANSEQQYSMAITKHQVITDWLAKR